MVPLVLTTRKWSIANAHVLPAMPKNVSAVRLNKPHAQSRNAAPKEPPSAMLKYMEESSPMKLDEVKGYFKSRLPKEFRVSEGVYSPRGCEGVAKGE